MLKNFDVKNPIPRLIFVFLLETSQKENYDPKRQRTLNTVVTHQLQNCNVIVVG